ncbi:methionine biosynthesis protein MetW [Inmirania thermothiophila]|uniref:Methionine biosynthesis protein MetW n=1 Tax=Inmirania thermothiophila TaxID=1750597 RepID=A0A3N1Y6U1_9GAMM|nr:methionine biosynthesis protein MetW [Inmirania thermothiophila]
MTALRPDLATISEWIEPGSRVLDLGCGDGTLLEHLGRTRGVSGYGIEIDDESVARCIERGVNVIQRDLDAGLADFDDDAFDYVVMTQTLQAVRYPHRLLAEMMRVGRQGIVTFPNFGHWRVRAQLALRGRMPVTGALPAQWYETANIHLCTVRDFEALCRERGWAILQRAMVDTRHRERPWMRLLPNLLGEIALYRVRRDGGG